MLNIGSKPSILFEPDCETTYVLPSAEAELNIAFKSSMAWEADVEYGDGSADWISLSDRAGEGSDSAAVITIKVDPNEGELLRTAAISIKSEGVSAEVFITQNSIHDDIAQGNFVFELSDGEANVEAEGGEIKVKVFFTHEYTCKEKVSWIREVKTKALETKTHTFEIEPNDSGEERSAVISFCSGTVCLAFTVNQESDSYSSSDDDSSDTSGDVGEDDPDGGSGDVPGDDDSVDNPDDNIGGNPSDDPAENPEVEEEIDYFYHRSLAMRFTADWCMYCPMMATSMISAQQRLPDKIVDVSVHGGGSSFANEVSLRLENFYPVTGYPLGLIDGISGVTNTYDADDKFIEAVQYTESLYRTVTGAEWSSSASEDEIAVDLNAHIKRPGLYKITVLLVEDNIIAYQEGYGYGYNHSGVLRTSFSDALGDPITASEDDSVFSYRYVLDADPEWDLNNCRVVVYIQRNDEDGLYYVDNAFSAALRERYELPLL